MAANVDQKYKKHELRDHIYQIPDTYIGSVEATQLDTFLFDDESKRMVKKTITYVPGLYKIFDEVIVNATDHAMRLAADVKAKKEGVTPMKVIKVNIDKETGYIEVMNDGDGIDVEDHPTYHVPVPQLIFGELLTSTNYDPGEEKLWGGKNGYGAKLTNIFSKEFVVETIDHRRKKLYTQAFHNNMKSFDKPVIKSSAKAPFTKIRFLPDYARFGMRKLSDDMYDLFRKRAMDACATTDASISIHFNNEKIDIKSFEKYTELYIGKKDERPRAVESCGDRWEVVATYSDNGQFDQVSFVNGILTNRGGKHVEYITNQITKRLAEMATTKTKKTVKPQYIKDNLMVFIKSLIVNPSFDTQTKDSLTTQITKFGSKCELSDKFFTSLYKTGIAEKALSLTDFHDSKKLAKTDGKKTNRIMVPKLDDANWAGTKKSSECTLILTEGDSARTMAISGLSVVGRDKYGVFPLRGKILNVKDAEAEKIMNNAEISNLKKILGLQHGKEYKDLSELRYGSIMIMTDQDSVTGDTPLLLKNLEGQVEIRTIDDIATDWEKPINTEKEYAETTYQVWTEKGWTPIKHVMRHKTTKRIYRVLTHTGCVDVTEDHSLLDVHGEKITPNNCQIGKELMHSFPVFEEHAPLIPENMESMYVRELHKVASRAHVRFYQTKRKSELIHELSTIKSLPKIDVNAMDENTINPIEAYAMGLFWADGSCGVYNWKYSYHARNRPRAYDRNRCSISWNISNTNLEYLEKAKQHLQSIYDYDFKIINDRYNETVRGYEPAYKLIVNGNGKVRDFVEYYRKLFYDANKKKRFPTEILNASEEVRKEFLKGYYDGDGSKSNMEEGDDYTSFDVDGKIGAMGLYYLCKSLGYLVSVNIRLDKPKVYSLLLTPPSSHQQANPNAIKKIVDMGITEQYVYDLETENHHFHAGVGQMIVHNTDGFHIKGLLFNVFQSIWPSLYKKDGFLTCMLTPIMKVTNTKKESIKFYSLSDFENWKKVLERSPDGLRGWKIKYYKGLGTSSEEEAKDYFRDMKRVTYTYDTRSDEAIDLAFNKKRADDRKEWLMKYNRNDILDYTKSQVPYEQFVHKELIHFSNRDLERSINHMCDGLKESTRKILFGCMKRKLYRDEIKVAQLAAYIAEVSAYHHGEASLQQAIIGMGQNFVGTNNINLLSPNGQFGTRVMGGEDAASPRYIFTVLTQLAKIIFREEDNPTLHYLEDDGIMVEPEYYIPIVPLILINGGLGIGTGFSTNVPCHNPEEIVALCEKIIATIDKDVPFIETKEHIQVAKSAIDKLKLHEIQPWYLGFTGNIAASKEKTYTSKGVYKWVDDQTVEITELPLFEWTDNYKEKVLTPLAEAGTVLKTFDSHYTAKTVRFTLKLQAGSKAKFEKDPAKFETLFKLSSSKNLSLNNIHLYGTNGAVKKYKDTMEVLKEWASVRIEKYLERKNHQLKTMEHEHKILSAKVRFIMDIIEGYVVVNNKKLADVEEQLRTRKYPTSNETEDGAMNGPANYNYLTRMPIYQLTYEKKKALEKEAHDLKMAIDALRAKPIQKIWQEELNEFKEAWAAHKEAIEEEYTADRENKPAAGTKKRAVAAKKK